MRPPWRPTLFTTLQAEARGGAVLFTYERSAEPWTDLLLLPNVSSTGTKDGGSDAHFGKR
jgi:hypothetical protein